jgi:hypothetical protein
MGEHIAHQKYSLKTYTFSPYFVYGYFCLEKFSINFVGTCSPVQVDPTGECSNVNRVFARDDNSSVNLASQGHCAGVFIGI